MSRDVSSSALKERERAKLAADVAEFLRRGGVIEQVDVTRSAGPRPPARQPAHTAPGHAPT
jgi:hypothetical protein